MNLAQRVARAVDREQQRRSWLAFIVAVWKKFGDDQAGNLAALIAYYAFVSLFPLLLVFVTVLDLILRNNQALHQQVLNSAFGQFPVIGPQLRSNVDSLHETGAALAIGLVLTFLGALGVASAFQNAMNTVWAVPYTRRPGFPWSQLRSIALILVVGVGIIVTTLLSGLAASSTQAVIGPAAHAGPIAVALLLNIGLFWLGFRLATASEVKTRDLFPGALASALVWQALQVLGGYIISHQLARSSSLYGAFALVLGLLAWLYLQAQFTLYAVELAVVRARRLWPRSLAPPPLTREDRRAYSLYARAGQRRPEEQIHVHISDEHVRSEPGESARH